MKPINLPRRKTSLIECICHHRIRIGAGTGLIRAFVLALSIIVAILIGDSSQRNAFADGQGHLFHAPQAGAFAISF